MALFDAIARDGGNLAFYYLVLHVVIDWFGTGTDVVRMVSLLAGSATVPACFLLGRRLFSRRAGLFAASLAAVSYPATYWDQNARGYTLSALLVTLATLSLVVALDTHRTVHFVAFGLTGVLACYTVVLALLVLVAEVAVLPLARVALRGALRRLVLTLGAMVLGLVPLAALVLSRGSGQLFWLGKPTRAQVKEVLSFLASATGPASHDLTADWLTKGSVAVVLLVIVAGLLWSRPCGTRTTRLSVALVAVWLVVPPVVTYLVSVHVQPLFLDRYFSMCLPAVALLGGLGLSVLRPAACAWAALVVVLAARFTQIGPAYGHSIDDWRDATTAVLNAARPGDCVAFYSNDGRVDFSYYLTHRPAAVRADAVVPRAVLPELPWSADPAIVERYDGLSPRALAEVAASCRAVFLLAAHDGHNSASAGAEAVYRGAVRLRDGLFAAYGVRSMQTFNGITLYLYSRPPTTFTVVSR